MQVPRLYDETVRSVAKHMTRLKSDLNQVPLNVTLDIYHCLYREGKLCLLSSEFSDLDTFSRLLLHSHGRREHLHHCFQAIMDHGNDMARVLASLFIKSITSSLTSTMDMRGAFEKLRLGRELASFLSEGGWFFESERVLSACLTLVASAQRQTGLERETDTSRSLQVQMFDFSVRLLNVYNCYCRFSEGNALFEKLRRVIESGDLETQRPLFNVAQAYNEFSALFFWQSQYDEAYKWSVKALSLLDSKTPAITVIDVLRQGGKACVVKREFRRAEMLIKQALLVAKEVFRLKDSDWSLDCNRLSPKIADLFIDYAFYLLNVDLIGQSVRLYEMALDVRKSLFGAKHNRGTCNNLLVAMAYEDLAYSTYVFEYSSGRFEGARQLAEKAMKIMKRLLPNEHLLLASAKRIKALILEEIAIDLEDKAVESEMLCESQELHLSALELARTAFGEMNVQTAKHYGNLGRLYQSMRRYNEAQTMHLQAIRIKEQLLGREDFEVALSLGHLASLYNYDMNMFPEAEQLYLRSIAIGIKLFGQSYSGLEYDYRGLLRVYSYLRNEDKTFEYIHILRDWKELREGLHQDTEEEMALSSLSFLPRLDLPQIAARFNSMSG